MLGKRLPKSNMAMKAIMTKSHVPKKANSGDIESPRTFRGGRLRRDREPHGGLLPSRLATATSGNSQFYQCQTPCQIALCDSFRSAGMTAQALTLAGPAKTGKTLPV